MEPTHQNIPTTQSPIPTPSQLQPPYSLPMSPTHGNPVENRTASLLQLLKFSHQAAPEQNAPPHTATPAQRPYVNSPPPPTTSGPPPHSRTISATDLVASLYPRPSSESADASRENSIRSTRTSPVLQRTAPELLPHREKSPVSPQDLVFKLLGRPKPVQQEDQSQRDGSVQQQRSEHTSPASASPIEKREEKQAQEVRSSMPPPPPIRSSSTAPQSGSTPATPGEGLNGHDSQIPSKGIFNYVNPFDQLHATSPRNRTPKSATPAPGAGRKSALGTSEIKAENIALPFTPSPGIHSQPLSPAYNEADASVDQAKQKERMLMEQLDQQIAEADQYPFPEESHSAIPDIYEDPIDRSSPEQKTPDAPIPENVLSEQPVVADTDHREAAMEEETYEDASETESIEVYNFPMKPFSSITIAPSAIKRPSYPASKISDIARMSRTFDQLDRNLIAASHQFIAYAMSKSGGRGGIRVIRQYDGKDKVLLKDSQDRTFNITVGQGERVLGTGVSGAVVWVDLSEDFESGAWNSMFVFPPSEEQGQSNGVLKSRARKTSRQLDVFAIGRGKTISIIHAPTAKAYAKGKNNEVASKSYLADHARTIDTGKASKDFAFSDDDSVIISIDKAGKLKFWDVQELLNFSGNEAYSPEQKKQPQPQSPMILSHPTLVFSAVSAGESYRATSVMFLDKFRPYLKCLALRYVIVGMKQNHTLQLWDLALGRPVQEINFPQESDTDALCSVAYHPSSGIIVVGNPTRNSIYFIHLSAPKYNLPILSQAEYIQGLANKNPDIPKPDATAILSGLREYSFASKGQLMSLDILDTESEGQEDSPALFELYVAHSGGMTTLSVYKENLGWEADNKVKHPVDAVQRGICSLSNMPPPPPPEKEREDTKSETTEASLQGLKPKSEKSNKSRSVSPAARPSKNESGDASSAGSKKKRKDRSSVTPQPGQATEISASSSDEPKVEKSTLNGKARAVEGDMGMAVSANFLDREVKRIETTVSAEFSKVMNQELEQLYKKFDDDRRVQIAAGDAKQDAILRLLSSTLTDNVEQVISRIVMTNIESQVLPAISDVAARTVERQLQDSLTRSVSVALPNELRAIVPDAVNHCLSQPDMLNRISDCLTRPLTQAVEREFQHSLHNSMIPAFQKMAMETAQKAVIESERKQNETIMHLENMHKQDSKKIDQLMATVKSLAETMDTMAKAQTDFQDQVRQAQEEYYGGHSNHPAAPEPARVAAPPQQTPEQIEAEEIESLLRSGKYEDGTIKWLQSKERQAELFDEVMVRYRYDFLPNLSQLVLLSVSAAVSVKFDNKVLERLSWLEGVLAVLDPMDPEIHEICQRIMVVVVQRLEQLYMSAAEVNPQNPIIRKIPSIARRARDLISLSAR
ncbi:hypothetical protein EDC01DRAFT_617623 [Geopyxis carbonaria]|nr:hypothetical protein EDC01DRAFT_617623 [Geopyxis carbonaria]